MTEPARFLVVTAEDGHVSIQRYQDSEVIEIPTGASARTWSPPWAYTFPLAEEVARVERAGGGTVKIPGGVWVNIDGTLVLVAEHPPKRTPPKP